MSLFIKKQEYYGNRPRQTRALLEEKAFEG